MNQFEIIVLVIVVVCLLAYFNWRQQVKRRNELSLWARLKNLSFEPENKPIDSRVSFFKIFQRGDNRYACNLMEGQWRGRPAMCFDYHYETHSTSSKGGRQTQHHWFSAVIVQSGFPLRPLSIRPENFLDKVGEFFGADDIDFESAEFSKKFFVKSPDRKWAYDVIHQRTMEFLLASPAFRIEFSPVQVLAYRENRFDADTFQAAAETACGLLDRFPDYLVRQQNEGVQ
jgi:hypothetical protein